jgi:hypothetical protein
MLSQRAPKLKKAVVNWISDTVLTKPPRPNITRICNDLKAQKAKKYKTIKKARKVQKARSGEAETEKENHNKIVVSQYLETMKNHPGRFTTPSVMYLDGQGVRTTNQFLDAGVSPDELVVANYDDDVIDELRLLGVKNSFPTMLEDLVGDDQHLLFRCKKYAAIYLDYCGTLFGGELQLNGDINYTLQSCLEHHVDEGTHISFTFSLRRNDEYAMKAKPHITAINNYINAQLEKYGFVGELVFDEHYGTTGNMYYVGFNIKIAQPEEQPQYSKK